MFSVYLYRYSNQFQGQQKIMMDYCFTSQKEDVDHFLVLHMITPVNYHVQFVPDNCYVLVILQEPFSKELWYFHSMPCICVLCMWAIVFAKVDDSSPWTLSGKYICVEGY